MMTYDQQLIHNADKIVVFQRNIGTHTIYCKNGLMLETLQRRDLSCNNVCNSDTFVSITES